jgi:hypothetical protein
MESIEEKLIIIDYLKQTYTCSGKMIYNFTIPLEMMLLFFDQPRFLEHLRLSVKKNRKKNFLQNRGRVPMDSPIIS